MDIPEVKVELLSIILGHFILQAYHVLVGPCPLMGSEVLQGPRSLVDLAADLDEDRP